MSTRVPLPIASRFGRWVLPAVGLGILVVAGWSWQLCYLDPRIRFLTPRSPAEWIVFPKPASFDGRGETELFVRFRQRWSLDAPPVHALLTYRAFTQASVTINGMTMVVPGADSGDWKSPRSIEVTGQLKAGPNEIMVSVGNRSGPPALWAWLDLTGR